jgi:hypothetical protein
MLQEDQAELHWRRTWSHGGAPIAAAVALETEVPNRVSKSAMAFWQVSSAALSFEAVNASRMQLSSRALSLSQAEPPGPPPGVADGLGVSNRNVGAPDGLPVRSGSGASVGRSVAQVKESQPPSLALRQLVQATCSSWHGPHIGHSDEIRHVRYSLSAHVLTWSGTKSFRHWRHAVESPPVKSATHFQYALFSSGQRSGVGARVEGAPEPSDDGDGVGDAGLSHSNVEHCPCTRQLFHARKSSAHGAHAGHSVPTKHVTYSISAQLAGSNAFQHEIHASVAHGARASCRLSQGSADGADDGLPA